MGVALILFVALAIVDVRERLERRERAGDWQRLKALTDVARQELDQ
jgi:hypothetical protein